MGTCQIQVEPDSQTELGSFGILPYAALRRAGVSPLDSRDFIFSRALQMIDECLGLEDVCEQHAGIVLAGLERIIGTIEPGPVRLELIHLRRNIFNDRLPKNELGEETKAGMIKGLHGAESEAWNAWFTCRRRRQALLQKGPETLAEEIAAKRERMKRVFRNHEFRKGLALASPSLSYELQHYLQAVEKDSIPRLARTERALLRYYSRCAFKLSPFSSFTRARLVEAAQKTWKASKSPIRHCRILRRPALNRALIGHLAQRIARHPELGLHVPLFLNHAAWKKDKNILIAKHRYSDRAPDRLRTPEETLVSIPENRAIEWISNYLASQPGKVSKGSLTAILAEVLKDSDTASQFIDRLIELGFLIHKVPLPEDDSSGLEALTNFVSNLPSPIAAPILQALNALMSLVAAFARAGDHRRRSLLAQMEAAAGQAFLAVGVNPPPQWGSLLLYEDTIEKPVLALSVTDDWIPVLRDLNKFLLTFSTLLDGNISARETIRYILRREFGGGPAPFLQLAERYNKLCFAQPQENNNDKASDGYTPNPLGLAGLEQLAALRRRCGLLITEGSAVCEEIDLAAVAGRSRWPEEVLRLQLAQNIDGISCTTCYVQPARTSLGENALVLNKVHAGPFRSVLRICSALSGDESQEAVLRNTHKALARIWKKAEPCEIRATLDFNVNLLPTITDRVINYSNDPTLGLKGIGMGRLFLQLDENENLLLTDDPSAKNPLAPVNFGMMATNFQPPLEYLLGSLGTTDPILCKPFDPYSWTLDQQQDVMRFPRLIFGKCILRRLGWSVRRDALPHRDSKETDFEYFKRVRHWQRKLGLPDEVFVRAQRYEECIRAPRKSSNQKNRNLYKPQYIHFASYFMVDLLAGLFKETLTHFYIEEALPDRNCWDDLKLQRPIEFVLDGYVDPMRV